MNELPCTGFKLTFQKISDAEVASEKKEESENILEGLIEVRKQ